MIALDANPDRGTLSDRSPGKARHTARQLVQNLVHGESFTKLSTYAAREGSRLDVLASDPDPHVALAFDDADYRAVTDLLSKYYSIVLTDSGTGMVHSVMKGTLEKAHAVVLGVRGQRRRGPAGLRNPVLAGGARPRGPGPPGPIVVINQSLHNGRAVNVDEIEAHFPAPVRPTWCACPTTRTWPRAPAWTCPCCARHTYDAVHALARTGGRFAPGLNLGTARGNHAAGRVRKEGDPPPSGWDTQRRTVPLRCPRGRRSGSLSTWARSDLHGRGEVAGGLREVGARRCGTP